MRAGFCPEVTPIPIPYLFIMKRSSFVGLSALAAALPALPALPVAAQTGGATRSGRSALVLIGGANRGAYEAGAIAAMAAARGLGDGQPLPFDMICGTSNLSVVA